MGTFSDPILGDGGELIRDSIRSSDYVPGVSGWRVGTDGSAEFSDAVLRGELLVEDPSGAYVRVYDDPASVGVLVELHPAPVAGYGPVTGSAQLRTGTDPVTGFPGLVLEGPDHGGVGQASLFLGRGLAPGTGVHAAIHAGNRLNVTAAQVTSIDSPQTSVSGDLAVAGSITEGGLPVVTGPASSAGRLHWNTAVVTTDATGNATVTHGAGFTPAHVMVSQRASAGVATIELLAEAGSYTPTTFRIRAMQAGAVYAGGAVGVTYLCMA